MTEKSTPEKIASVPVDPKVWLLGVMFFGGGFTGGGFFSQMSANQIPQVISQEIQGVQRSIAGVERSIARIEEASKSHGRDVESCHRRMDGLELRLREVEAKRR
jgi:hypothetical protein